MGEESTVVKDEGSKQAASEAGRSADETVRAGEERSSTDVLEQAFSDLSGQNTFLRQQVSQLYGAVDQLYQAVSAQCRQLLESDNNLKEELQKFQSGGPQRAMAAVFHKLFRDLIAYMNELDDMVVSLESEEHPESERMWIESMRVARDHFESILKDWGCLPIEVKVGEEEFDPEIHESVEAQPGEVPESASEHVVVKVHRRGWQLHNYVLQHPQVVVG